MRPAESLPLYKKFLKIEEHRLRLRHQYGGGGREICALRVELIDVLMQHIFDAAVSFAVGDRAHSPTPLTLIALGGYGRRELNPFSDVDIMFLHQKKRGRISPYAQVIEQILYLLWDVGFKVGTPRAQIGEASTWPTKMLTKTAMPSLARRRFETGGAFRRRWHDCVRGHEREYAELVDAEATRHAKFGDTVYVRTAFEERLRGLRTTRTCFTMFSLKALTTTHLVGRLAERKPIGANRSSLLFSPAAAHRLHYATGRATATPTSTSRIRSRNGSTPKARTLRQESS